MKLKTWVVSCGLALMFFSANLLADVKFGIGTRVATFISLGTGGSSTISTNTLSIPINLDGRFIIEPEIVYTDSKDKDSEGNTDRLTTKGVSIGIFGLINSETPIRAYYGARVGMSTFESEYQSSIGEFISNRDEISKSISPTIGAEVQIVEDFSIAGELGLTYTKSDSTENLNTTSRLMVRFLF